LIIDSKKGDPEGPKDANEALKIGIDFKRLIATQAATLNDQNLLTIGDLRDKVFDRFVNSKRL
jgi:hypothetical protein